MKRISTALLLLSLFPALLPAQSTKESYQEFRKGLHSNYRDFRGRILSQYADFLNGVWHPYEPMDMPQKYSEPKPEMPPVKKPDTPAPPKVEIPAPPRVLPQIPVVKTPAPVPPKEPAPTTPPSKEPASAAPVASGMSETIPFYGMEIEIPKVDFRILNTVNSSKDTPAQWKALEAGDARKAASAIKSKAEELGLNGYLTYLLTSEYVGHKFPSANDAARVCTIHYLLANMGYDVRLALTDKGMPLILLPFAQKVYGSVYLTIDGKVYTAFPPEGSDIKTALEGSIYTCQLPKMENLGADMDLKLNGLRLPYKPYDFSISSSGLTLKGTTNANLFPLLYRYPQMPTQDFASSVLDPELRKSLVEQVKTQLKGKNEAQAINTLLHWFHEALPYATDEQRHGFEKPYFMEELFYYDKCDCEDRAIAFTWLLWNALGVENHLLAYPMHESAAVRLDSQTDGYSYSYDGSTFWSADPTYIGSSVGDVMPQFNTTAPKIDKVYK